MRFLSLLAALLLFVTAPVPAQTFTVPVEYFKLDNGLKVVVSPDRSAPVVLVEVIYNIGFRVEPKGRTGFAHLFEHMMFQGSANVKKMQHVSLMQEAGGIVNGSTRFDYTNYFQSLPSNGLERALFLEADRMRSLDVTAENLKNQQNVVSEEVRVNVLNQPHGAFDWIEIWEKANTNWHNAHNFYGALQELEAATIEDVRSFFKTYYAPNNAVLVVSGATTADRGQAPAREALRLDPDAAAAAPPSLSEPAQDDAEELWAKRQAGADAGDRHRLAPAAADDQGFLRIERARSAAQQRRQRADVSQAGPRRSARHVELWWLQLPWPQLGHEGADAVHHAG